MDRQLHSQRLGMVIGGSLTEGLVVKLDPQVLLEDMAVGRFVTIESQGRRFFGVITDMSLGSTDPKLAASAHEASDPFIAQVLTGTATYGVLHVTPMLVMGGTAESLLEGPQPAKTVPSHFATVRAASDADVEQVFGKEDQRHLYIGSPLDMESKVCLDLHEMVKRSNGVFGKSGTGKTFLTRILLAGIVQNRIASSLVFDMHSEYGWSSYREDGTQVKALKQLFPARVGVFTLDPENSRRRGVKTDFEVAIGYDEIEPEDISLLRETLNLSEVAAGAAYSLERRFGRQWLQEFLALQDRESLGTLASQINVNEQALSALHRRLERLRRLKFLVPEAKGDSVNAILGFLRQGKHVVLEFGRYGDELAAYILVANILTRRIHARYMELTEEAFGDTAKKPNPLLIVIEEAHKFLSTAVAGHTIFGIIAREMRKYNVTLLVIDQRPSGIDDEVMSQIGTKLCCLLDNDKDIDAVLTGTAGARQLRAVLAKLESKQQALLFGHALPMPVVIRTRPWGTPETDKSFSIRDTLERDELWGRSP
jgi:DNA helicase HerA-like ATPase